MSAGSGPSRLDCTLATVERWGNRLPDPAFLFVVLLVVVWIVSALLAPVEFAELDPRTRAPLRIENLLSGKALAAFLAGMVTTFTGFHPLGVVLVAMLGVGVAEQTGFIDAGLKAFMARVGRRLLTPAVLLGSIVSHTAADAGYVLVIPLAGSSSTPPAGIRWRGSPPPSPGSREASVPTSSPPAWIRCCRRSPRAPPRWWIPGAWSIRCATGASPPPRRCSSSPSAGT